MTPRPRLPPAYRLVLLTPDGEQPYSPDPDYRQVRDIARTSAWPSRVEYRDPYTGTWHTDRRHRP